MVHADLSFEITNSAPTCTFMYPLLIQTLLKFGDSRMPATADVHTRSRCVDDIVAVTSTTDNEASRQCRVLMAPNNITSAHGRL